MYKFKIKPAAGGQFRVQFLYNSEILVWSENFTTKAAAKANIDSIKANAPSAAIVDLSIGETGSGYRWQIVKAVNGEYFTRFKASNGETMVRSETYTAKHNAKNCAQSVSANAAAAPVVDETTSYAA
ncbi:YegP family protein [Roseibium album]|uniref:YegP family protein n=1 Tax=Roseibium album TaxID=311410 RepID=UPI002491A96D|nr:YegP family protein [Roseibium album]